MFRATDYDYTEDLLDQNPSMPSTAPQFVGTAFRQQETEGVLFTDPGDDRVSFVGDAYDPTAMHMRFTELRNDIAMPGGAFEIAPNGYDSTFTDTGRPGNAKQSLPEYWYDTLRPAAGYQLPSADHTQSGSVMVAAPDETYAAATGDVAPERYGQHDPLLVEPGVRITERALDMPFRLSGQASSEQTPNHSWDTTMGMQEWVGLKSAQERPIATSGPYFMEPLADRIPSSTGAGGAMVAPYAYDLFPEPLTFRAAPVPWDQGVNAENGFYVESGN